MRDFVFQNKTKIVFGRGQVQAVGELAAANLGKKVLMVLGRQSSRAVGLIDLVAGKLAGAGIKTWRLWGVTPNPSIESAREGVRILREAEITGVLAIGGGSVIDCAKAIAVAVRHGGDAWELFTKKIKPQNPLPIGCVVTISATGSEANGNSVMSDPATEKKLTYYHPDLYPAFSILDPELTFSVPADQTAYGAVDIMSHVYEQFFHGEEGTDIQDGMAIALMRSVIKYGPMAMARPDDYTARANLMWAATLALNGVIGAGAAGDWTCHMLEHELSAKHKIAHGAGLAIVFPPWMRLVAAKRESRFRLFLREVWGVGADGLSAGELGKLAHDTVTAFYKNKLGIGVSMRDYGIAEPRIAQMVESLLTYKRPEDMGGLSRDDLTSIYQDAAG
jgi:hypothetical protein